MRKYRCIRGLEFEDSDIPPVKIDSIWIERHERGSNCYVHLEHNGEHSDWLAVPEEGMYKYFKEIEE